MLHELRIYMITLNDVNDKACSVIRDLIAPSNAFALSLKNVICI